MRHLKTAVAQIFCLSSFLWLTSVQAQNASVDDKRVDTSLNKTSTVVAVPGNSVYKIPATLTDQNKQTFHFTDKRGKPLLISMFYNSCEFVCPMLIDSMRTVERSLTPAENDALSMMLVTFDPARDNSEVLQTVASQHRLDSKHWTVARTDPASVRKIAAALGIQYRLLESGEFNHTTVILLLDAQGRIIGRTSKIGEADPEFIALVKKTLSDQANQKTP